MEEDGSIPLDLTDHLGNNGSARPSILELAAEDSMTAILGPAVKYLLRVLAARFPQALAWSLDRQDEVFTVLNALLQGHHLRHYAASFGEHFYGLKRTAYTRGMPAVPGMPLSRRQRWWSLFFLVRLLVVGRMAGGVQDRADSFRTFRKVCVAVHTRQIAGAGRIGGTRTGRLGSRSLVSKSVAVHLPALGCKCLAIDTVEGALCGTLTGAIRVWVTFASWRICLDSRSMPHQHSFCQVPAQVRLFVVV